MATLKNTTINDTGYLEIPTGVTNDRPVIKEKVDNYTSAGNYIWTCPTNVYHVEVLVVAGGGGGGAGTESGGGGGAGGLIHNPRYSVIPGNTYNVVVGAGGAGAVWVNPETIGFGSNGGSSSFGQDIAVSGGGGGAYNNQYGLPGGSGGGATDAPDVYGGRGTDGQGNDGGNAYRHGVGSAGGGGAGSKGRDNLGHGDQGVTRGNGKAGDGGDGLYFEWLETFGLGDSGWIASGGSGGARVGSGSLTPGRGRPGGGGDGGAYNVSSPTAGVNGTGSGGGGGGGDPATSAAQSGADGGDGLVAIRYFQSINSIDTRGLVRYNSEIKGVEIFNGKDWIADNLGINFAGHNRIRYSEQLENAAWSLSGSTITSNVTASPFGQITADKLVETASTTTHYILQDSSVIAGKWYVHSVFAKEAEKTFIQIAHSTGFASNSWVNFNLTTGVYSIQGDNTDQLFVEMIPWGDGWYRCSVAAPAISTTSGRMVIATSNSLTEARLNANVGNSSNGVFLYGIQFEQGTTPGPYVRTVSAAMEVPVTLDGYRYHVYKNVGISGFTAAFTGEVEVLIVGGGGAGGGGDVGAGGGAGGVIYRESYPVNANTRYNVIVGAGAVGIQSSSSVGPNGENSSFDKLVAIGGGGGAGWGRGYGAAGGSGGASTYNAASGVYALPGVRGQGHAGGKFGLPANDYPQPGGGGAGGPGSAADATSRRAGDGGYGVYIPAFASIGGDPAGWFGGGGAGGVESGNNPGRDIGLGGLGGGGDGGRQNPSIIAQAGTANTGGGGGGEDPEKGGNGGSGIVAIRYRVY